MRLQTADDPKTLDPAVSQYADGIAMLHLMYDSLFSFDDKGALIPRAAAVVPGEKAPSQARLPVITLGEEELSDVSLSKFFVYDREATASSRLGVQYAQRCGGGRGCGGGCRGCGGAGRCGGGGCAVARCARCGGGCAVRRCGVGCGVGIGCAACSCSCCISWGACQLC